jgi:hypothetical protein
MRTDFETRRLREMRSFAMTLDQLQGEISGGKPLRRYMDLPQLFK